MNGDPATGDYRSLSEAKHLYERAGFVEVEPFNNEPYAHHWFQKDLRK
jgi:hypothetical protein